jgi:predicted permease
LETSAAVTLSARRPARPARVLARMAAQLLSVFFDVVAPVFAIVALGWALGPRLGLDAKTLSRAAYYVFVPAFTFDVISRSRVPLASAGRMAAYAVVTHLAFGAIAFALARVLRRPRKVVAAWVMLSVFGNVGNFGLALIQFRLGAEALAPATIYFIVILLTSFTVCVGIAAWTRDGGGVSAAMSVFRTPAIVVAAPALIVSVGELELPLFVNRTVGLLGGAMIPSMLFVLGVQLSETRALRPTSDTVAVAALRLVGAPLVAWVLAAPFRLSGLERASGILQAGMPAAILVAIIATEYDVEPGFVTAAVLFSTLLSLPTLTVLLAVI